MLFTSTSVIINLLSVKFYSPEHFSGREIPSERHLYHIALCASARLGMGFQIATMNRGTGKLYTDLFEVQILELGKLPEDAQNEEGIIRWMRFFSGKKQEEFIKMAKTDEYLDEAYQTLLSLSADERKRLEYEARERAVRDQDARIAGAMEIGENRVNQLNRRLMEQDRMDDMIKATVDSEFQARLFKEFHL